VNTSRQQGAPVAISSVHACAVVDQQCGYLATAVHRHVQLEWGDAGSVDVVDARTVGDE